MGISWHVSTLWPSRPTARCFEKQVAWLNGHRQGFTQGFHVKAQDPRLTPSWWGCLENMQDDHWEIKSSHSWEVLITVTVKIIVFPTTERTPNPPKWTIILALYRHISILNLFYHTFRHTQKFILQAHEFSSWCVQSIFPAAFSLHNRCALTGKRSIRQVRNLQAGQVDIPSSRWLELKDAAIEGKPGNTIMGKMSLLSRRVFKMWI